jgi:DNA-binding NarL/FixJ family response regulator
LLETDISTDPTVRLNGLTPRELEVLNLIAQEKSNKVIAAELSHGGYACSRNTQ